jgi:hypothetical protein
MNDAHRNIDTGEEVVGFDPQQLHSSMTARNDGHIRCNIYEWFSSLSKLLSKDRAATLARFESRHVECLMDSCERASHTTVVPTGPGREPHLYNKREMETCGLETDPKVCWGKKEG